MSNPLKDARDFVAAQVADLNVNVYSGAPEVVTPPAIIVNPSNNWLEQATIQQTKVTLDVKCVAQPAGKNVSAQERLEELVWAILNKFPYAGSVDRPLEESYGQARLLTATVPVSVHVHD
jgi:hypothetical protein